VALLPDRLHSSVRAPTAYTRRSVSLSSLEGSLLTLSPHGSWVHVGPHHNRNAAVALRHPQVCMLPLQILAPQRPCPFWLDRAPWPPSLLRQAPTRGFPGHVPAFHPTRGILSGRLSPLGSRARVGLSTSVFRLVTRLWLHGLLGMQATPVRFKARTAPPGPPT